MKENEIIIYIVIAVVLIIAVVSFFSGKRIGRAINE